MSDQYATAKNTLLKKIKTGYRAVLILVLSGSFSVSAANIQDSQELIQQLGIQQQDLTNLNQGEVVYFDVTGSDEKELSVGAAIYLPISPSKVIGYIKNKNLTSIDTEITAEGAIPLQAKLDSFKGFNLKAGGDEATNFLAAKPGSKFNLSTQEFQSLQAVNKAQPDAASQAYRKILWQRWQDYRKSGLKGIATYDRGNGTEANPGEELRTATLDSKTLARYFPELTKAWLNYPDALPTGVEEKFLWRNRKVEGRPTAILIHRATLSTGNGEVIVSRQFYAGHSYNSNQLIITCLPYLNGSLVFYANRTFTDQVAGVGSSLKHSIGEKQVRSEMTKQLKNLRKILK
ncbi:MAG: hypothetical protein PHO08_15955 [Methylococcales bacterium]|nr:hypothetical protein [Methylococcales bacterium]